MPTKKHKPLPPISGELKRKSYGVRGDAKGRPRRFTVAWRAGYHLKAVEISEEENFLGGWVSSGGTSLRGNNFPIWIDEIPDLIALLTVFYQEFKRRESKSRKRRK